MKWCPQAWVVCAPGRLLPRASHGVERLWLPVMAAATWDLVFPSGVPVSRIAKGTSSASLTRACRGACG